jgi:hypothetical protein
MPARFLLQPNGKLARFSTIVDNFTHANLTEEEAYDISCHDMGRQDATNKVARGLARGLDDPLGWNECLETIKLIHGQDELDNVIAEIENEK